MDYFTRNAVWRYVKKILAFIAVILLIGLLVFLIYAQDRQSIDYTSRSDIQRSISDVVRNGGSIEEVRHVYESRKLKKMPLLADAEEFEDSNYRSDISLSHILSDLLVNYYASRRYSGGDSIYASKLHDIVNEYNAVHPFDGLEEGQKYYLQNIQQKLDTNYVFIEEDLVKVGDELDRKNQLVNKYLNKSELSFWISIAAVAITIILSVWQIAQNRKANKKIDGILKSSNSADDGLLGDDEISGIPERMNKE